MSVIEIALKSINGKDVPAVTSLQVAEHFQKNHKDVLRDIRVTIEKCSHGFRPCRVHPVGDAGCTSGGGPRPEADR